MEDWSISQPCSCLVVLGGLFTGGVFSKMRSPVAQAGFGLLILLPLPPEWLDYRHAPPLTMI